MNSLPKALTIKAWLTDASHDLIEVGIGSAKLDAEIILAHTLQQGRTYLHAHNNQTLTDRQLEIADARLSLRRDRTPIAYIIGHKEFYGRMFKVTPATLIPRPESETMIDLLTDLLSKLSLAHDMPKRLVDVGTGSGCLGITAKLEFPLLDVALCDVSRHALKVAQTNAKQLGADVMTLTSDLLDHYPFTADVILANLPYVNPTWPRSPETNYEPEIALFASKGGLQLIYRLIQQAVTRLSPSGLLLLEADPRQHSSIVKAAETHNFTLVDRRHFILGFRKI